MTATTAVVTPEKATVPAGEGVCVRAGCGRPLLAGERGRSRRFCSEECRRRHYNAQRGKPATAAQVPDNGPGAELAKLSQLLTEASQLAAAAAARVAGSDPGRVAATLAEAEAARRSAEAHAATATAQALAAEAQSAESAESAATAWEAADAADAIRSQAEEHARAAQERIGELERQLESTCAELTAAKAHAADAERQAAQAAAERDAAERDRGISVAGAQRAAEDLTAARQQAEREIATIQAACHAREEAARELAAAATARAERAEAALDAERAERRDLTDRLTVLTAQSRTRTRPTASEKIRPHDPANALRAG